MKIGYLLESTDLWGGVKVALEHVRILRELGLDAATYSPAPAADWFEGAHRFHLRVDSFAEIPEDSLGVAVATYWTTVEPALRVGRATVHFCQGYEGDDPGLRKHRERIDSLYRLPTVKWSVSPTVAAVVRSRFGQETAHVPPPFDPESFRPPDDEPAPSPLRVLVPGLLEPPERGVPWAYESLQRLVDETPPLRLVRLCQALAPGESEMFPGAEHHVHVPPRRVPPIHRGVHVLVAPSRGDGFGLPLLEAMGCGRACVTSDADAYRDLDPGERATVRVRWGDVPALGDAVRELRDDPARRARMGAAGREIALGFDATRTREALERELGALAAGARKA